MSTNTTGQEFLSVKEMAAASGLSEHTLRYYEKIGLIKSIPRDLASGHRRYGPEVARTVEALACLHITGMSIDDMRQYLVLLERGNDAETAARQKALFETQERKLEEQIARLRVRQQYLAGKVAYWEARLQGDARLADRIGLKNRQIAALLRQ